MSDINLKISIRNGRLLRKIREKYDSTAEFCRVAGLNYPRVSLLTRFQEKPVKKNLEWTKLAIDVATALGVTPGELWPDHMREAKARRNSFEVDMEMEQVAQIAAPESQFEKRQLLLRWIGTLSPREKKVMRLLYEGATHEEIGSELGVGRQRVHQIRKVAAHKIRQRAKKDKIEGWGDIE